MLILCVEEIMYLLSVDVSKMLLRRYWTCWRQTFRQVWRVASKKQEAKHSKDVSWERMGRRHFQWEIFNFVDIRSSAGDVDQRLHWCHFSDQCFRQQWQTGQRGQSFTVHHLSCIILSLRHNHNDFMKYLSSTKDTNRI